MVMTTNLPCSRRRRFGFTLVELLVVIGIIAVLIGILLPALSKARDQANTVKCAATMKQFYNAWQMYATNYKGHVLPTRLQDWDPQTGGGAEFGFFEGTFLGSVLKHNSGAGLGGGNRGLDTALSSKKCSPAPPPVTIATPMPTRRRRRR